MKLAITPERRLGLYRAMLRVRLIEERVAALYAEQEMRCPTHFSIGQEAVAAGVCAYAERTDYAISAHRSHAHYLTKGGDLRAMLAELYGKETGCARGKGGSMHLIDLSVNFLGCVPIVGSTIPIGVGASFGAMLRGEPALAFVFFGDGAAETGVFHESLNFATLHRLPVVFVCENNYYSVNTPLTPRQPEGRGIDALARSHGMPTVQGDGQEIETVFALAGPMIEHARAGKGPVFLEFFTYRWLEHCGPLSDRPMGFRPEPEFVHWLARCPIRLYEQQLEECGLLTAAQREKFRADIEAEIDDAVEFAKSSDFPDRGQLTAGLFADVDVPSFSEEPVRVHRR